jgi:hypothetical protein
MRILALFVVVLPLAGCGRSEAAEPTPQGTGLFEPIASVVMHPRCVNCHQDESPRQTDQKIVHRPFVVRGKDGHGAPTQPCQTCHQATNTADGFVPGVTTWHLAPLSMLWEGKTKAEICEQMKDPERNGGRRTGGEVIEHMKVDPLVLWAWDPGGARTMPPLTHAQFVEALEAWVGAGMPCPTRGDR